MSRKASFRTTCSNPMFRLAQLRVTPSTPLKPSANPVRHRGTTSSNHLGAMPLRTYFSRTILSRHRNCKQAGKTAAQTTSIPDYSASDLSMSYAAYDQLNDSSNLPNSYQLDDLHQSRVTTEAPFPMPPYQGLLSQNATHPRTPPSRPHSSSRPPPPLSPPPPTTSRAYRLSKRRSKVGSLRLPKSVGNLKIASPSKPSSSSTSSENNLRSHKSAGALKSSKSSGGLKSHTSGCGVGGFGFVNFTPSDKGKILTGWAPSGSSKTKARRELEALEKKRRLSLAAEKAIIEAGGDVEGLRREGLL